MGFPEVNAASNPESTAFHWHKQNKNSIFLVMRPAASAQLPPAATQGGLAGQVVPSTPGPKGLLDHTVHAIRAVYRAALGLVQAGAEVPLGCFRAVLARVLSPLQRLVASLQRAAADLRCGPNLGHVVMAVPSAAPAPLPMLCLLHL